MFLFRGPDVRRWPRLLVGAALAAGTIVLTWPGASASAIGIASNGAGASGICPNVRAGGHNYDVRALNVPCSFADRWASSLAGRRLKADAYNVEIPSGPPGFTCDAGTTPHLGGLKPRLADKRGVHQTERAVVGPALISMAGLDSIVNGSGTGDPPAGSQEPGPSDLRPFISGWSTSAGSNLPEAGAQIVYEQRG